MVPFYARHKNQNAHEVSRELTAWALSGIEPILMASLLPAWARLGPLGTESQGTAFPQGRLMPKFSRHRSPNGVAWRFPDWTAVGFRFRKAFAFPPQRPGAAKRRFTAFQSLFLGSSASSRLVTSTLAADRLYPPHVEGLSPSGRQATGGDINPDCHGRFRAH